MKKFILQQREWLQMENLAEKEEYRLMREGLTRKEIEKMGNALLNL